MFKIKVSESISDFNIIYFIYDSNEVEIRIHDLSLTVIFLKRVIWKKY